MTSSTVCFRHCSFFLFEKARNSRRSCARMPPRRVTSWDESFRDNSKGARQEKNEIRIKIKREKGAYVCVCVSTNCKRMMERGAEKENCEFYVTATCK